MTSHFVTWSVCLIHQLFKYIHIHCLPSICGFGDICSTLWTPRVPTYCIVKCSVHWWILSWNSWTNNKMYIVQSVQCTLHCTIPSFSFLFLLYNALYIPHEDLYRLVHETFSCLNSLLCDFFNVPSHFGAIQCNILLKTAVTLNVLICRNNKYLPLFSHWIDLVLPDFVWRIIHPLYRVKKMHVILRPYTY